MENFHIYEGFKILNHASSNILEKLEKQEFRIFRKRVVEMILSTDMANHSKVMTTVKYRYDSIDKTKSSSSIINLITTADSKNLFDSQQDILNFLIHGADISNPAKKFSVYKQWASRVMQEFFEQGDIEKEKGLPVSFLCDRTTTVTSKAQIGFINNIVLPLYKIATLLMPSIKFFEDYCNENSKLWEKEEIDV